DHRRCGEDAATADMAGQERVVDVAFKRPFPARLHVLELGHRIHFETWVLPRCGRRSSRPPGWGPASCRSPRRSRKRCCPWSTSRPSSTASRRPSLPGSRRSSWSPAAGSGRSSTISTAPPSSRSSSGRVHEVADLVEKPSPEAAPSDLAILGRYVLANDVFGALHQAKPGAGGEIQLTDAIRSTIATGRVVALEFEGEYYDTGEVPGYLRANISLALKRDDLR